MDNLRDAWMTQSQRSRYLKSGGVVAFFLFLLLLFSGRNTGRVGDIVKGMCFPYNGSTPLWCCAKSISDSWSTYGQKQRCPPS